MTAADMMNVESHPFQGPKQGSRFERGKPPASSGRNGNSKFFLNRIEDEFLIGRDGHPVFLKTFYIRADRIARHLPRLIERLGLR